MRPLFIPIIFLLSSTIQALALPQTVPKFSLASLLNGTDTQMPSQAQVDTAKDFITGLINDGKQIVSESGDGVKFTVPDQPIASIPPQKPAKREAPDVHIYARAVEVQAGTLTNSTGSTPATKAVQPVLSDAPFPVSNTTGTRASVVPKIESLVSQAPYPWTRTSSRLYRRQHIARSIVPFSAPSVLSR